MNINASSIVFLNEASHGNQINALCLPGSLLINIFLGNTEDLGEHYIIQSVQLHLISIHQQSKLNVYHTKRLLLPCFGLMTGLIHCPLQAAQILPLTSICACTGPRYGENCNLKAHIYQGKKSIRLVNI